MLLAEFIMISKKIWKELIVVMANMIYYVVPFFLMLLHLALILLEIKKDILFIHKEMYVVCVVIKPMVVELPKEIGLKMLNMRDNKLFPVNHFINGV
jgi:hypothetical protein